MLHTIMTYFIVCFYTSAVSETSYDFKIFFSFDRLIINNFYVTVLDATENFRFVLRDYEE